MASSSFKKVIYAALFGNLAIALMKFGAAWLTGSSAMTSEAVHSLVDTGNEVLLLYGIRRDLQNRLVADGYRVRVYIPYGKAWYPYFMRRFAERPANVLFLIRNLMR